MTAAQTQNPSEYERGLVAGEISARLAAHDLHFGAINGSMGRLADEMHLLVMQVQRLGDSADADRATVKVTALALKDAEEARRDQSENRWAPSTRLAAIIAALAAAASTITYFFTHAHR